MASWDDNEPVTFKRSHTIAGVFIAACFFVAGALILYGQGF